MPSHPTRELGRLKTLSRDLPTAETRPDPAIYQATAHPLGTRIHREQQSGAVLCCRVGEGSLGPVVDGRVVPRGDRHMAPAEHQGSGIGTFDLRHANDTFSVNADRIRWEETGTAFR